MNLTILPQWFRRQLLRVVALANRPLARHRTRQALGHSEPPLRIEIGGFESRSGWVVTNVDATCRHYLDATEPWPVAEGSVEYVFSDNVIEHLSLEAGRAMLREAFRALRPGGIIRLVTPDVRRHVEAYLAGQDALHSRLAHEYVSAGLVVEHAVDLIRIPIGEFGHHVGYVYDFATLADELELAGFHSIVRCDVGVSTHDALDGLDMRVALGDGLLAVEATR